MSGIDLDPLKLH